MDSFEIAARRIGPGQPCFVIAEAGVNHNGDLDTARRLIDAAAQAGAAGELHRDFPQVGADAAADND